MNKTYRTLALIILSSTFIVSAMENVQQDTPDVSFYTQTTAQLHNAWQNKWVKVGTVSIVCAIIYAIGVRCNVVPAPSLPTASLLALPFFAKKQRAVENLPQNPKSNDVTDTTTKNTPEKEETVETFTPSNNEQPTEKNTDSVKTKGFPSKNDLKEAIDGFRKLFVNGLSNYTPYKEEYK
jgi:hypothetical protein